MRVSNENEKQTSEDATKKTILKSFCSNYSLTRTDQLWLFEIYPWSISSESKSLNPILGAMSINPSNFDWWILEWARVRLQRHVHTSYAQGDLSLQPTRHWGTGDTQWLITVNSSQPISQWPINQSVNFQWLLLRIAWPEAMTWRVQQIFVLRSNKLPNQP